jgi:hypothetical protein
MPNVCIICNHRKRLEIDRELVTGKSKASIARQFNVSHDSLLHHESTHLSRQLVQAYEKKEALESLNLLERIDTLLHRAELIFQRNYDQKRDRTALKALSEQRNTIELLSKIAFALHQAKADELQNNRNLWESEQLQSQEQQLSILNDAELEMLEKLTAKISEQDSSIIVIPEKRDSWLDIGLSESYSNIDIDIDAEEEEEFKADDEPALRRTRFAHDIFRIEPVESTKLEPQRKRDHSPV